ncbi:hypothetical protein R75461_01157 [Paraburkholderia nemoris]|uniref:hypothetical protein n=1 Tax=Paraburkholderia nemoris TaxID=2793076 RepID=UPI001B20EA67|nr:hypothetical protein [Paraburkholderia nemoris]CAE6713215.1 hypothetical protein R75461_01157 [Paraburkholderia nemoris]
MNTTTHARARELTGWFPADVKPVHVGVYHVRYPSTMPSLGKFLWARWNGEFWTAAEEKFIWVEEEMNPGGVQCKEWRGLTEAA